MVPDGIFLDTRFRYLEGLMVEHAMSVVTLDFPDETIAKLGGTPEQFSRELRQSAAIFWYSNGLISQGTGAEIAGLSRREFIEILGRAEVEVIQVTIEDLKGEVERDLQSRRERLAID